MKFYHWPGSSSIGIHILLNELNLDFDAHIVALRTGAQQEPEFQAISDKGKVPALVREDGSTLTEFQAIAFWLAEAHPEGNLVPKDLEGKTRALELMDYIVGTVHMRGVTFILMPQKFLSDPEGQETLRAHGREIVTDGFQRLSRILGDKPYLLGDFSIADAGLFYLCHFAGRAEITMPDNINAFYARMKARPAVAKTLEAEGWEA